MKRLALRAYDRHEVLWERQDWALPDHRSRWHSPACRETRTWEFLATRRGPMEPIYPSTFGGPPPEQPPARPDDVALLRYLVGRESWARHAPRTLEKSVV